QSLRTTSTISTYTTLFRSNNPDLIETLEAALDTSDPRINLREGGENKSWETERFLDKPLVAVLTLLSKIQIDIKNSEANLINYRSEEHTSELQSREKLVCR